MEIKRKIYQKLLKWKEETNGTKALFLEGARRIGKSTIAKKFAQNEYDSFVLIDFNNVSKKLNVLSYSLAKKQKEEEQDGKTE